MTDAALRFPAWPEQGPDALERELLAVWKAERLFPRVQEARRDGPPFVFYEGPPTANGRPGIHHVFSRTIKDLFCRFRVMQGHSVTRIAGWDTHGLPVEIEVEKKLALSGKKAIEEFGVAEFNRLCRESVFTYQKDWEDLSDRIGYWLDYDHPYITCSPEYIESVWWLLKQLHDKQLLVQGHRVLPYCPRCGTALSSHELAQGYERISDKSVYVTFPLEDDTGREFIAWTTAPWTLPSNTALAVHPDLGYVTLSSDRYPGRHFIVAEAREAAIREILGGRISVSPAVPGSALAGLRYRRPLEVVALPDDAPSRVVVTMDFVAASEGTGVVHITPAFGADDFAAGKRYGLALVRPVAGDGTFVGTTWPELEGKLVTADATTELLIQRLKQEGRHLRTEQYVHDYPHCWRCQSKLIYYAKDSWFVRTSVIKQRMLDLNATIGWQPPEMGTGRFGDWLANNVDWALSRDRYWGTPLPVWVSDRDPSVIQVIGSYAELLEQTGLERLPPNFDPHKPGIDAITWPAPDGGTMRRVPEVIDTWFDSGSMPTAQWHYPFEHHEEFKRHYPADLICEGVDQTRGWFYSLLAIGATVFDQTPYRNVVVNEQVLDVAGQKMSKSRGNMVDPWELLHEIGADSARLYFLASSDVGKPKRFDRAAIPEVAGGFLVTLKSAYSFFQLYSGPDAPDSAAESLPLDRWLRSRLAATVAAVTEGWDAYDPTAGVRAVMDFVVDDLSQWWIRQSRARFWAPDKEADPAAVRVLKDALITVARLLAPAAPFASDWLHRALTGESVHLALFPQPAGPRELELEDAMAAVRRLASLGRAAREARSLRVRQPLGRMRVALPRLAYGAGFRGLLPLLAQEVNVREVEVVASDADLVRLRARPNFRALGKRYGKRTPDAAAAAARLSPDQLRALEGGQTVTLNGDGERFEYGPGDVEVEREVVSDWLVQSSGSYVAALDPELTEDLRREGLAREVVNRVQRLRKDAGYEYTTRIALWLDGPPTLLNAVRVHAGFIQGETLARALHLGAAPQASDRQETLEIDDYHVVIAVARHPAGT